MAAPLEKPDFLKWFDEDELSDCPSCGEHTIVTTDAGATICTECGYLGFKLTTARRDPPSA